MTAIVCVLTTRCELEKSKAQEGTWMRRLAVADRRAEVAHGRLIVAQALTQRLAEETAHARLVAQVRVLAVHAVHAYATALRRALYRWRHTEVWHAPRRRVHRLVGWARGCATRWRAKPDPLRV